MREILAVTWMNLCNLPQRLQSSSVVVIGICGVVAVLLSVLALATGFRRTIDSSASPERAIVLSRGAESEGASSLTRIATATIANSPGIRRVEEGPVASAEILLIASVARKTDGNDAYVTLRGVGSRAFQLRPEAKLVAGRMFKPAVHELIVGRLAQSRFAGLEVGKKVLLRGGEWTVVGVFESGGNALESSLLADANTVLAAYKWQNFSSITVEVGASGYERFKDALLQDPTLQIDVWRESDYMASIARPLHRMLNLVGYGIGAIMAIGALFAALNTMYSAVSARSVEIATLRAIGFRTSAVVASVFAEAVLLAMLGAVAGTVVALFAFDGNAVNSMSSRSQPAQLVYQLSVSSESIAMGAALALLIGVLGGLLPAIRAARMPIAAALRDG